MTCKHLWEPNDFGIKNRTPNLYLYQCRRCGQIISAALKGKPQGGSSEVPAV